MMTEDPMSTTPDGAFKVETVLAVLDRDLQHAQKEIERARWRLHILQRQVKGHELDVEGEANR